MFKPAAVIPVYNHERRVGEVVQALLELDLPCVLVNDGSNEVCSDVLRTIAQAHAGNVYLYEHANNQGKGGAISTGLRAAKALGFSHAVQVDADGQHNLADIPLFLIQAARQPNALICGYPVYDDSVPKHRLYARYLTHVWIWINTVSLRIKDSMCGFRVYPLSSVVALIDRERMFARMSFDPEVLVRADWSGIAIVNTPTKVHYPEDGVSHFLAFKDNALISLMHTRLFFGMLWRFPRLLPRFFRDKPLYAKD